MREVEYISNPSSLPGLAPAGSHPIFLYSSNETLSPPQFSYFSLLPKALIQVNGSTVKIKRPKKREETYSSTRVLSFLGKFFQQLQQEELDNNCNRNNSTLISPLKKPFFSGGLVGFFSYEFGALSGALTPPNQEQKITPDAWLAFYNQGLIFDHYQQRGYLFGEDRDDTAQLLLQICRQYFQKQNSPPLNLPSPDLKISSTLSQEDFQKKIVKCLEYIAAGDIYQANISHRFQGEVSTPAPYLFEQLQTINPAPFAAYLDCGPFQIISNSPEMFFNFQQKSGHIVTAPIKGTCGRGDTPKEDMAMASSLQASEKDRAENLMIVDLERNDLGRFCHNHSVEVTRLFDLVTFPHWHHLVSEIKGRAKPGSHVFTCLENMFPGGSITGAPKIRSMQIIRELEPTARGIYTGSIGYIDLSGDALFNIAIRTAVKRDNQLYFQVGGGIVADSDPEKEYLETMVKASAFFKMLGIEP